MEKTLNDVTHFNTFQVNYREEALKRLQQQQKDCLDEVSRREKAIQKLELELLKAQEQARLAQDEVKTDSQKNVLSAFTLLAFSMFAFGLCTCLILIM